MSWYEKIGQDPEVHSLITELQGCLEDSNFARILSEIRLISNTDYQRWQNTPEAPYNLTDGSSDKHIQAINYARSKKSFKPGSLYHHIHTSISRLLVTPQGHPIDEVIFAIGGGTFSGLPTSTVAQKAAEYLLNLRMGIDRAASFLVTDLIESFCLPQNFRDHHMVNVFKGDEINIRTNLLVAESVRLLMISLLSDCI